MKDSLLKTIERIVPTDDAVLTAAKARQDSLAKPPGSLGGLEDIGVRLAGIFGAVKDGDSGATGDGDAGAAKDAERMDKGCVIVFCADNGVAAQGVSSAPQSVTRAQTINFTRRLTGVGTLAKSFKSELLIVDMGVKDEIPSEFYDDVPMRDTHKIVDRRIRPGTGDISEGPAMTEGEAIKAMLTGIEMAKAAVSAGHDILGIGEMGIGNTTTSAAVLSGLTGKDSNVTCGRGGGVNDAGFEAKKRIVDVCSEPYRRHGGLLSKYPLRPVDIEEGATDAAHEGATDAAHEKAEPIERLEAVTQLLARCGGFDICAMTGAYLGAAACRVPVVIDGYISVVAALAAATIKPETADYMFASHKSAEPGYELAIKLLGFDPFLDLGMRLGEGSGCPIAFAVIKGAWDVMNHMGTFEEAEINDDYLEEVRRGGCF